MATISIPTAGSLATSRIQMDQGSPSTFVFVMMAAKPGALTFHGKAISSFVSLLNIASMDLTHRIQSFLYLTQKLARLGYFPIKRLLKISGPHGLIQDYLSFTGTTLQPQRSNIFCVSAA